MNAHVAPRTRSAALQSNRRVILRTLVATGLLIARAPARMLAQEATPPAQPLFTGETFVGETSDPDTFVAVIVAEGPSDTSRPARGYLCNGLERTVDAWLTGEATDDRLELAAEDGSRLTGVLNAAGIGGGATLPNGRSLVFTALPATGLAGLYTVTMVPEGRMEGDSAAGAHLVGSLQDEDVPAGETYRYDVTVTPPDGRVIPMTFRTATTEEGAFRLILLADGRGKGQGKTKRTGDWTDPNPTP